MLPSATDTWETPQDFFNALDNEFHFALDVCAAPENAKCKNFFTKKDDGLSQNWGGMERFGAILHMGGIFINGLRKRMRQHSREKQLSCFFRHEQTQDGFMIISTAKLKSDLLKVG